MQFIVTIMSLTDNVYLQAGARLSCSTACAHGATAERRKFQNSSL
jgi:hypothetical protein